jgi:hypothetical protein
MTNNRFSQEDLTEGLHSQDERPDGVHRIAQSDNNLDIVCREMGWRDRAIEMYRKSLTLYKRAGDARGMVRTYTCRCSFRTPSTGATVIFARTSRAEITCLLTPSFPQSGQYLFWCQRDLVVPYACRVMYSIQNSRRNSQERHLAYAGGPPRA